MTPFRMDEIMREVWITGVLKQIGLMTDEIACISEFSFQSGYSQIREVLVRNTMFCIIVGPNHPSISFSAIH